MTSHYVLWRHTTCYDVTPRVMTSHHVIWRHTTCYDVTPRVTTSHCWAVFITALGLNVRVVPLLWIFSPWITLLYFLAEVIVKLRVSLAAVISVAESVSIVVLTVGHVRNLVQFRLHFERLVSVFSTGKVSYFAFLFFRQDFCLTSVRTVETAVCIFFCSDSLVQ